MISERAFFKNLKYIPLFFLLLGNLPVIGSPVLAHSPQTMGQDYNHNLHFYNHNFNIKIKDLEKKLSIHKSDLTKKNFLIAETTETHSAPIPLKKPENLRDDLLENIYPPKVPAFTRDQGKSISYTNEEWLSMDIQKQAQYLHDVYKVLLLKRGHEGDYSPRILTCKDFRESVYVHNGRKIFQTQKTTSVRDSSASGVSQVLPNTAKDVFDRHIPSQMPPSVVPGFENILNGAEFHEKMAGNMIAQMELSIMVIRSKQIDTGAQQIKTLLKHYHGNSKEKNKCYSDRVFRCAKCMVDEKGVLEKCLDKALGDC